MSLAIDIQGLQKTYASGTQALAQVNLRVEKGDFFALLGANGAGKSTLINILSGLVTKTSGSVCVNGVDMDVDHALLKRHLGVVPQEFNFNIFETPENILITQAGLYGIPRTQAKARAEELLRALTLWEKRNQPARDLSGGMKRRLMIARALMHEPTTLLLDEPTAGVDVELRHGMWEYLKQVNAEGVTILLTTHYLEEVEQLCQNVTILHKGKVVREGTVAAVSESVQHRAWIMRVKDAHPSQQIVLNGFLTKRMDNGDIQVMMTADQDMDQLFDAARSAGIHIIDIREDGNRLERLMLEIIGQPV